nr:MAG TPA: hypothetical protein [Bacteriophage sp.]
MSKKKLLYIEDLYDFYLNKYKRSTHFSAEKSGQPLVVQVYGQVKFDKDDKDKEGLLPVHLQSCHTNLNLNGSYISEETMNAALPSFSNRPILGYIHKVVTDENPDGQWEFYSHNMHEDEDGELVYDEYPIGIIPESCNAKLVYDEDKKKTYCEVDGYIFEEYSKAAEILEREGECNVSVELSIRELSYEAKQKFLNIEDFWFSGVTILGKTPQGDPVNPGMKGSNIKLSDFSSETNSMFSNYESKMIELQERLEKLESTCFNNKEQFSAQQIPSKEGGNEEEMNKFEELLKKYNVSAEDITFEYSELSDEELEAKFKEAFEDDSTEPSGDEGETDNTNDDESTSEPEEGETSDDSVEEPEEQTFEKMVRSFEVSHEDIRYALYNLLSSYESADNEWYFIDGVYDTYFVYESWDGGKIYGQKYTKENNNVAFDGERYTLHKEYLTDSEYAEINDMRSNYAAIKEELSKYQNAEIHAQKEAIVSDEKYSVLTEKDEEGYFKNEAYAKLISEMDNYSLDDLEKELKSVFADYITGGGQFAFNGKQETKPAVSQKKFAAPAKDTTPSRYGNLFKHN